MTSSQKDRRPLRYSLALVVAAAIAAGATGCSSADSTPPLFAATNIPITVTEFRIRLNDYTEYFVAVIDDSSEHVIDTSDDQVVRRNAMEFRLLAVNVFLNSLNQPGPVASLVDAWALCLQLEDYVAEGGVGAELFGEHQPTMIAATQTVRMEIERVVEAVAQGPSPDGARLVYTWADDHPLTSTMMVRSSTAVALAEQLESSGNDAFAALGRLQAGVDEMVSQYQRYISVMPRTVRWHSQLILHETLYDELDLGDTKETFDILRAQAVELGEVAGELLAGMPNREELEAELAAALADLQPLIDAERARLLTEVDRQRGLIFDDVAVQREAIMADVESQIALVEEQIQGRLGEVFTRIEALTDETLARSFDESERLVNVVYARVLTLLIIALLGGAGLMVLRKRLNSPATGNAD